MHFGSCTYEKFTTTMGKLKRSLNITKCSILLSKTIKHISTTSPTNKKFVRIHQISQEKNIFSSFKGKPTVTKIIFTKTGVITNITKDIWARPDRKARKNNKLNPTTLKTA